MFLRNVSKDNVNAHYPRYTTGVICEECHNIRYIDYLLVHYPHYTIRMICEKRHNIRYIDYLPVYYPRSTIISFKTFIFPIYFKVNACLRNNKNITKNMLVSTTK